MCQSKNKQPLKETKEVQTEYEEKASQVTEKSQETEPEVQDLENQILRTASGKFFQKYPVDEAFMGWIETKYGSGVLQSLYTQLENGNQDSDLWYRFTGNSMHVLWLMYCRQQQYMSYSYEDVIWKEASDPACIRLDFVGDICLDENWCTGKTAKNHMADYFSDEVKKELISADFTMANNEFAYTTRGQRQVGKAYCFRADPQRCRIPAHTGNRYGLCEQIIMCLIMVSRIFRYAGFIFDRNLTVVVAEI